MHQLLTSPPDKDEEIQPEGMEDLSTLRDGTLISVAQVKAYSEPLSLSSLRPEKADSFLYRSSRLLATHPECRIKLVSFGEVGPELRQALVDGGSALDRLTEKLSSYGFLTKGEAQELLKQIKLEFVNEAELEDAVLSLLRSSMAVGDSPAAFDILQKWLLDCAENSTRISRSRVYEALTNVGRFVAERAEHHLEWFSSILPMEARQISPTEASALATEFYAGVAARCEHILAGLDIDRPSKLRDLRAAFQKSRVVILHGASGQGKSTLAYRYMHDAFPDYCRLTISVIDGASHALRIAAAIREQARALNLPLCVYVDVTPGGQGWTELVQQVSRLPNVWTLVAVREEDLRRADLPSHQISCESIPLDMDETEAQSIFKAFSEIVEHRFFLSFDEAWDRFGGEGPLLEFVHLITQGDSLRSRLSQQVNRLRDSVRLGTLASAELTLLRLVSVAGAAGARLAIRAVTDRLQLPDPKRTIEIFEKEYLVRISPGGATLEGLHPIRSAILSELLTDNALSTWEESAAECLPLCEEGTIGAFLFHVFAQPGDLEAFYGQMNAFHPATWAGLLSCLQGILWWGVWTYVQENMPVFRALYDKCGDG
ncbi:MAG TPA: hypothetical protein VEC99_11675 [Clostridia bacterium]|nr:hypothetical protein [Clostridia bacterium]